MQDERVARQEETIQRLTRLIELQGATIAELVQRSNDSEDRNAQLLATLDRIQEAVAADREAHPQLQPADIHAGAYISSTRVGRKKSGHDRKRMGLVEKIFYYFDRQPLLVKLQVLGLGIAVCAAGVCKLYVMVQTPLGERLISLLSNPSAVLAALASVEEGNATDCLQNVGRRVVLERLLRHALAENDVIYQSAFA